MSLFLDAARLITNLGSLGEQFIGVDSPNFSGEYLAASATSMGGDLFAAGSVSYKWKRQAALHGPIGEGKASIILSTLAVVEVLELTTGFGPPNEGDDLKVGSEQFATVSGQLGSAFPDDNWQGSASQAYADRNTALQNNAQTMADLDLQLAAIVKDQADWVTHIRLGFGILKDLLAAAFAIELAIKLTVPPPGGLTTAQLFATIVAGLGATIAAGMLGTLCYFSVENAKKADALTTQYTELAAAAVLSGTPLTPTEVPAAVESTVSSFEAISSSMSGMAAMPDVATLASLAPEGASPQQRALLSALMGEDETPGDGTPAFTMPTLAQVTAMSGQAAKLSGYVGQHMNLVNQMTGQVQQLASMAQQGQAAPPAKETTPAEDVDGAGAALGTEAAERAPIELAAVGAQQAQEPIPMQRIA
jgi:uncharacterized protein YukE